MIGRWFGPVFEAEQKTRARRWQGYALRSAFVSGLLGGLTMVWSNASRRADGMVTVQAMAQIGSAAYFVLTFLQLVAVLLIAPAATAGAICLDKSRGALAHVFVTDLTDREIVLGKLAARLFPVWGLLACALPVAAMATLLGGIDPMALTGMLLIAAGVAFLGCSFALMLSVWASKTHEVLSVVFGVWFVWLLACPVYQILFRVMRSPAWLERSNPFYLAFAPYNYPGETSLIEPALFALGCLILGAGCVAMAVRKVRVVACRSPQVRSERVGWIGRGLARVRGRLGWDWGPKLDRDPVLWREWHRNRPTRWTKAVWLGFGSISTIACVWVVAKKSTSAPNPMTAELHGIVLGLIVTVGLFLISTSTASVLTEERARGSLDVLISTPVSTREILRAKWWGAFRRIPRLIFWPLLSGIIILIVDDLGRVPAALICLVPVLILMQGAALVSLGLALATWIKRTGQATTWTITVMVLSVVGWPILGGFLELGRFVGRSDLSKRVLMFIADVGLIMGSPIVNAALPYMMTARRGPGFVEFMQEALLYVVVGWTLIYGLGAWLLFELTVRTFDRCLGRMPERTYAPRHGRSDESRSGPKAWGGKTPGSAGRPVARASGFEAPPR